MKEPGIFNLSACCLSLIALDARMSLSTNTSLPSKATTTEVQKASKQNTQQTQLLGRDVRCQNRLSTEMWGSFCRRTELCEPPPWRGVWGECSSLPQWNEVWTDGVWQRHGIIYPLSCQCLLQCFSIISCQIHCVVKPHCLWKCVAFDVLDKECLKWHLIMTCFNTFDIVHLFAFQRVPVSKTKKGVHAKVLTMKHSMRRFCSEIEHGVWALKMGCDLNDTRLWNQAIFLSCATKLCLQCWVFDLLMFVSLWLELFFSQNQSLSFWKHWKWMIKTRENTEIWHNTNVNSSKHPKWFVQTNFVFQSPFCNGVEWFKTPTQNVHRCMEMKDKNAMCVCHHQNFPGHEIKQTQCQSFFSSSWLIPAALSWSNKIHWIWDKHTKQRAQACDTAILWHCSTILLKERQEAQSDSRGRALLLFSVLVLLSFSHGNDLQWCATPMINACIFANHLVILMTMQPTVFTQQSKRKSQPHATATIVAQFLLVMFSHSKTLPHSENCKKLKSHKTLPLTVQRRIVSVSGFASFWVTEKHKSNQILSNVCIFLLWHALNLFHYSLLSNTGCINCSVFFEQWVWQLPLLALSCRCNHRVLLNWLPWNLSTHINHEGKVVAHQVLGETFFPLHGDLWWAFASQKWNTSVQGTAQMGVEDCC